MRNKAEQKWGKLGNYTSPWQEKIKADSNKASQELKLAQRNAKIAAIQHNKIKSSARARQIGGLPPDFLSDLSKAHLALLDNERFLLTTLKEQKKVSEK